MHNDMNIQIVQCLFYSPINRQIDVFFFDNGYFPAFEEEKKHGLDKRDYFKGCAFSHLLLGLVIVSLAAPILHSFTKLNKQTLARVYLSY